MTLPIPFFPAAPVQQRIARIAETASEAASQLGVDERAVQRVLHAETLSLFSADVWAIRLNSHPLFLWDDWKVTL